MKTKELRYLLINLSSLNNSFTHYLFVWTQFNIDYEGIIVASPDQLTSEYFTENPNSVKHNIAFNRLKYEHDKTNNSLIKGVFLLIYSYFEDYLKGLFLFSKKVDISIVNLDSKIDAEEDILLIDKVVNRIKIEDKIRAEHLISLDYLRLKRNRLIHRSSTNISDTLNDLIKKHGKNLNNYWSNELPGHLHGIDFSDKQEVDTINLNIIIDTINIIRRISIELDFIAIGNLDIKEVVNNILISEFKNMQGRKMNGVTSNRVTKKFVQFCKFEYNITLDEELIELFHRSIA